MQLANNVSASDVARASAGVEEERALMEEVRNLVREAAMQFSGQFDSMRGELDRVHALLSDAIEDLTDSFRALHGARDLKSDDAHLGKAVTALQFHDMVSQLLGHVGRRVDALDDVMRQFNTLGAALDREAATSDVRAAIDSLREEQVMIATALRGLEARTLNNPVGQRAMTRGDVELF
ncbi:MAG: hypothetical protein AB1642_03800 [Pseudomonadota bacterium]